MTSAPAAATQTVADAAVADAAVGAGDHRELAGKIRNRYVRSGTSYGEHRRRSEGRQVSTISNDGLSGYETRQVRAKPDNRVRNFVYLTQPAQGCVLTNEIRSFCYTGSFIQKPSEMWK